ncbi:hypothetical protein RJ55_06859 [Drechmeria coniospora]|nr:hypothetical protein RJ55_06859 [Drechmeria coniospora]
MSRSSVPIAAALSDIYPVTDAVREGPRWNKLLTRFADIYHHSATFVARSPGRVNIIGEHIDYSLYSVLPMAVTADALLAVSAKPVDDGAASFVIQLANVDDAKFASKEFSLLMDEKVQIDASKFEWTNYFKCGLSGALELLRKKRGHGFKPRSMEVLMDGNIPVGGGLSSSAAFVTASALAVLAAHGEGAVDKKELTELAMVSERAVGVNSGGMDQAASVFSEPGSALFVTFSPGLDARPVRFPATKPELCFVIAQSFVTSNKQVTGPIHYNLRVVEVTLAAAYLNALVNPPGTALPTDGGPLGTSLHAFHETYFHHQRSSDDGAVKHETKEQELQRFITLTRETLTQEEGYTKEEIAQALGQPVSELERRFLASFPVRTERFKLRQRALHVFTEALRVLQFLARLERPSDGGPVDAAVLGHDLGRLMNETQESCRSLFECSCPELDQICTIARAAGAWGSRLTGAGWGGCSVHLVPADKVADVKAALETDYYAGKGLTEEQRERAVVVSRPAGGSALYMVDESLVGQTS